MQALLRVRIHFAVLVAVLACATSPARANTEICYKTTRLTWDAAEQRAVSTSPAMLERLAGAFALWKNASGGALRFRFEGFDAPAIDGTAAIPYDGCIHAVLYGARNFHGELAHGRYNGTIPGDYKRGYFFVSRDADATQLDTLAHEIGHALGLAHAATPDSIMFSGRRTTGDEPRLLSEQDAADVLARWTPGAAGLYTIDGVIQTDRRYPMASVFAVPVQPGPTYSARSDHTGRFSLALLRPGDYRLVARPIEEARDLNPAALGGFVDSWFVSSGASAPERERAAILSLSDKAPAIRGLRLGTLDATPAEPRRRRTQAGAAVTRAAAPVVATNDRPPVLRFSFDAGVDDEGILHLAATANGDELRLVPGKRGRALFVGGTEDWLDVPLSDELSFDRGFTLELWFRRADWENPYRGGSGWQTLAALSTSASIAITAPGCPLHAPWALHGSISRRDEEANETDTSNVLSPGGSVPSGQWMHAAMVHDPAQASLSLYVDGNLVDVARGVPPPDMRWRTLRLGTRYKANQAFRGEIDEVEVYDFPRTPAAIAASATGR